MMFRISIYQVSAKFLLNFLLAIIVLSLCHINIAEAENSDTKDLVKSYVSEALDKYKIGDHTAARELINKALSLSSQNGDYPGVYIQSGYLYMKDGDCESALKEIKVTKAQLEYLKNLSDQKKISPEKEFGKREWDGLKEYYYLATYISAYCNYRVGNPEESIKNYLVLEKERSDKFGLFDMTKLAHDYQMIGDNSNAIRYYLMSLKKADEDVQENPFNYEKIKNVIETVKYNIAISYYQQHDLESAVESIKSLLGTANDPYLLIDTMEGDKDYNLLLRENKIRGIVDSYKANKPNSTHP